MLIDMHAHSSAISPCCCQPIEVILDAAKESGIDGIVLTNHYSKSYFPEGESLEFAKKYIAEYENAKCIGEKKGVKVFFGIEVTMEKHDLSHLLVYGVGTDFVLNHPQLYDLTQRELYELTHKEGGALIQAHPKRKRYYPLDTAYLDGVELSCHPLYDGTKKTELTRMADERGLILTVGGDYHADTPYRPVCGMYLPDNLAGEDFGKYLINTEFVNLCVHEVGDDKPYNTVYRRKI